MRLDKLTLYGFKSFADKTEFLFERGLTAFVGPNGCGKSNVVDAVRWALGEQRPKALRGSEMADVIFKGNSEGRRSMGYAEVTLSMSNHDHALPIEYEQVAVTRRLYRSGESEYLLNGQPCRLRDIRELLMDTGIGMDAYSIVEQGKIDMVLQSNPRDRRAVFEEAAGISKYNAKRRAALAKLERVEQNLLRLGDTIQELQKQLRSIRRQAAAARRYKEYAESLGRLRLAQALHRYHGLVQQRAEAEAAIAACDQQQEALAATLERLGADRTARETESIENDQRLARVGGQCAELQAQTEAAEESIRLNRERIRDAEAREQRTQDELRHLGTRVEAALSGLETAQRRSGELQGELQQIEVEITRARQALQGISGQCAELARRSESLRTGLLDVLRRRAGHQNELAAIESECRAFDAHRQRLERRRDEIARLLAELAQEREAAGQAIEGLEHSVAQTEARFAARAEERGELRAQIETLGEQIAELTNALSVHNTRRDMLEDLEARFEGVELGTQTLLERQADRQFLHGMVADLLQVEPQYALAIEAALGGAVQHLVADTLDSAAQAVAHLKAVDGGRSTLLPLDRLCGNGRNGFETLEHPGVVDHALNLIQYSDAVAPAVKHLLGDTFVVRDLEAAVDIARRPDLQIRLATLSGDVVDPRGMVSGGSPRERTGLLSRKNELRTLSAVIAEAEERLAQLRQRREHFINESAVLDTELEDAVRTLNHLNLDLATAREQLSRLGDRVRALETEDVAARSELDELAASLDERRARGAALGERIQAADREEEDFKTRLGAVERERQALDEQRSGLERKAGDLAVTRAERASEREHLRSSVDRLRREASDGEAAQRQATEELEVLAERRRGAAADIAAKEQEIRSLLARKDALQQGRVEGENRRAELLERIQALRGEAQAKAAALHEAEQEAQALQLRVSEADLRRNDLVEKVREEHQQDLLALHEGYQEPEVDWAELQGEVDELRRKLDGMGTVNLLAIEEQTQLEDRLDFLTAQEQDLQKAKGALQEVIRKVNRQSRQLFEQTFAAVRENFQMLFRKLFNGGKADIVLEAGVDVLEAGVEIIAKPPGKELSRISLLSGGEKALTAAAILLAIFKSRPSPFCILDEVDAPLDDNNIGRFVSLLREFLKDSQFIIVTHSKQTMAVADVLYGITMHEAGVSTKVAVRFDDVPETQVA
ncbi:MAG TPA: chromosome segregation protein SMC [Planctomycetota bacterium]|nr:chromosome segregation protein SMC [Planctomycetota bacterium]